MTMTSKVVAAFGAALLAIAADAAAQSLGDVAKQEEARRKEVKPSGKVYTNDNIRSEPAPSTAAGSGAAAGSASADKSSTTANKTADDKTAADKTGDKTTADKGDVKDEKYWTKRMADARSALERSQSFAQALQTRINSLTTDFTNRDDPAQRAQIGADRDKALAQLEQLKKEIADNTKAIAAFLEYARKAGVPAGWVR
jgi:hypothetical protein